MTFTLGLGRAPEDRSPVSLTIQLRDVPAPTASRPARSSTSSSPRPKLDGRHAPGPEPDHPRDRRPARPHASRDGDSLQSIAYAALRRPDALARDRRGQRHRRPARAPPRLRAHDPEARDLMPASTDSTSRSSTCSIDGAGARRGARGRRVNEIRVRTSCGCPTSARSRSPTRQREGARRLDGSAVRDRQAELEVKLGSHRARPRRTTLFKGEIVSRRARVQAGGVAMSVRAYDRSHRCMRSRKQRTFQNQTLATSSSKVVGEAGISVAARRRAASPHDFVPAEQRDRLGVPLAAGAADRLRGARRRHTGCSSEGRPDRRTPRRSRSSGATTCSASSRASPASSRSSR